MKVLFVSNPAHGQFNPLESIAHELLIRGHSVHICSAERLKSRIERLGKTTNASDRLFFHPMKDGLAVEDLTPWAHSHPTEFHSRARHVPGDLASYVNLVCSITSPGDDEYRDCVFKVRDVVKEVKADMVVVDNFSPFAFDGVRLSGVKFIATSPGAACAVAKDPSPFKYPVPLSGASGAPSSRSGLSMLWRNFSFIVWFVWWCSRHPFPKARRTFRKEILGLEPVDLIADSFMTPVPGMLSQMVAALSFNVAGLDLYSPECFNEKVFFVGPCYPPVSSSIPVSNERDEIKEWLDEAQAGGEEVVYVNFGSIFYYTAEEYDALIEALTAVHSIRPLFRALIKVPKLSNEVQPISPASELPPYIRRETWIPSITAVLEHPSIKVAIHHGGGNSFNEAVSYGHPQLIISQWGECHDNASYALCKEIGLTCKSAPKLVTEEIVEALETLLRDHQKFKANCQRWKIRCDQAGGSRIGADVILHYGSQKVESDPKSIVSDVLKLNE